MLSLIMSYFVLSCFPREAFEEILDRIEPGPLEFSYLHYYNSRDMEAMDVVTRLDAIADSVNKAGKM